MRILVPVAFAAALAQPAAANDSIAALDTGGLVLEKSADIEMVREHLTISLGQIAVDYTFRNRTDRDLTARVAFPMPDVTGSMDFMTALPSEGDDLLGFQVTQDGKPLKPVLDSHAFDGKDEITDELNAQNVPLQPYGDATEKALEAVPQATADDWEKRGIIGVDQFDAGKGPQTQRVPLWRLSSAWHWQTTFPAGKPVEVSHRYTPSVGGSSTVSFVGPDGEPYEEAVPEYRERYCTDDAFLAAVRRNVGHGKRPWNEQWIGYILGTGANWAGGRIGDFTLEVDKGRPDALVSFCAEGKVEKISPMRFRFHATDFTPPERLDVLILQPVE